MSRPEKWTPERCKEILKQFQCYTIVNNLSLTQKEYNTWRHGKDAPHARTIEIALGGQWTSAKTECFNVNYPSRKHWSDEACDAAIEAFQSYCSKSGQNTTAYTYKLWKKDQKNVPSFNSLTTRGKQVDKKSATLSL